MIVGYDDALSAFRIINSWGADWGIGGYGWIDYAASKSLIRSAYVTRDMVASPDDERPVAASGPSPGNAVNGVAVGTVLSWTRNARTTSFDVYLGTNRDLAAADFQGNVAQATFSPDLAPGSRYYWRIDARGAGGVTPGLVWSFTTAGRLQLPGKAIGPSPAHRATAVAKNTVLRWDSGGHTTSYDVYFGTNPRPAAGQFQGTQATRTFSPVQLLTGTRYYWRIDANNGQGTTTGDVWSFTTVRGSQPGLSVADASITEGNSGRTTMSFRMTLSAPSTQQVRVSIGTVDGTATANSGDYDASGDWVTFSPGETSKRFPVVVRGDTEVEDDETFTVDVESVENATTVDRIAIGTIINDDVVYIPPILSIADANVTEGDSGMTNVPFRITLSAPSARQVKVWGRTIDGTATAESGDYQATHWITALWPGQTSLDVEVGVFGDTEVEQDETFTVQVERVENATLADDTAIGTIMNDDVRSPPRLSWRSVTSGTTEDLYGVAWNGSRFVAVGNGTILYSTDGITWTRVSSVDSWNRNDAHRWPLFDIASNAKRFVAVGGFGIARSPDGITWTRDWTDNTFGPYVNLYGVVWSGTRFVAVGSRTIANSFDGITWAAAAAGVPSHFLYGVAWNGTRFVAVGFRGSILHSTDGNTWTAASSGTSWNLRGVAWNGTRTVAVGMVGTIVYTVDGIIWRGAADSGTSASLNDVAWNGSRFVAVGEEGTIVHSSDGSSWSAATGGTSRDLRGIGWSGARFVAVGHGGTILVSP